jgi:predicted nuclease with TOPRIM domain
MAIQAEVKDWKTLRGIGKEQFAGMMKEGKLDRFLNDQEFVNTAVKGIEDFTKPVESAKPTETPVSSPTPSAEPVPVTTPPAPVQAGGGDAWWAKRGFASEQEAVESIDNLRQLNDEKQTKLDRFNAERGTLGREKQTNQERIRQLEADLKRERDERSRLQTGAVQAGEFPVSPIVPIPEDGLFDTPEFKAKMADYRKDMQSYNEKMSKLISETRLENQKLKADVTENRSKTTEIDSALQETQLERQTKLATEQWQTVLGEVAKLQDYDPALKTSKPFTEINDFVRTRGYEEASKIYPKKDMENFDRLCDVIKTYRSVDGEGHVDFAAPARHRSLRVAYHDMLEATPGKLDEFVTNLKTQGERQGREQVIKAISEQGSRATVLPPGGQAGEIIAEITDSDLDQKLTEYSKPQYDSRLKSDPALQKEVYDLMVRKAEKDPSWRSMIPTAWITKFQQK